MKHSPEPNHAHGSNGFALRVALATRKAVVSRQPASVGHWTRSAPINRNIHRSQTTPMARVGLVRGWHRGRFCKYYSRINTTRLASQTLGV